MTAQGIPELQAARDPGGTGGRPQLQVIAQEIPEVQREVPPRVDPQKRVQQRTAVHFVDVPVPQVTPQVRFSKRIEEHIVDVPVPQGIPQEPISERIRGQIVDVPGLRGVPQERISKRIQKQIVDVPGLHGITQERISERIQEPIVDVPVPAGRSTSSSAAVPLDTAECAGDKGFRTFSSNETSAKSRRQSTAKMQSHCQPSTRAAYDVEHIM